MIHLRVKSDSGLKTPSRPSSSKKKRFLTWPLLFCLPFGISAGVGYRYGCQYLSSQTQRAESRSRSTVADSSSSPSSPPQVTQKPQEVNPVNSVRDEQDYLPVRPRELKRIRDVNDARAFLQERGTPLPDRAAADPVRLPQTVADRLNNLFQDSRVSQILANEPPFLLNVHSEGILNSICSSAAACYLGLSNLIVFRDPISTEEGVPLVHEVIHFLHARLTSCRVYVGIFGTGSVLDAEVKSREEEGLTELFEYRAFGTGAARHTWVATPIETRTMAYVETLVGRQAMISAFFGDWRPAQTTSAKLMGGVDAVEATLMLLRTTRRLVDAPGQEACLPLSHIRNRMMSWPELRDRIRVLEQRDPIFRDSRNPCR